MHAQMSSFMRFFPQRSIGQVYKNVDRAAMLLAYVTPVPITQIINTSIESWNRVINIGCHGDSGSNLI